MGSPDRLWLIPLAHSLPAIQAHFRRYPDHTKPPSVEETRAAVELANRFVAVSRQLIDYILALGGKPRPN